MSLFTRSYNKFAGLAGSGEPDPKNQQNITYRKKISAVSTSLQGNDGLVAASPRNVYSRNNVAPLRRRHQDEVDGDGMSSSGRTPVEKKAAEIRRNNSLKERIEMEKEENTPRTLPPPPPQSIEGPSTSEPPKKPRNSTSSLASVFRSRAGSPIERMRKFIKRSSSKQSKEITASPSSRSPSVTPTPPQNEQFLVEELEKVRNQLAEANIKMAIQSEMLKEKQKETNDFSQQIGRIRMENASTMTDKKKEEIDKENVDPDVIRLGDEARILELLEENAVLKKERNQMVEDFRQTRKDFILILKEAVLRKDKAERQYEMISKNLIEDDDWLSLTVQHAHASKRNALLMWVQEKLEIYSDQLTVSNFSSDWTDCRAFCALLYDLFPETMPDILVSPIVGDCVSRCRRAFQILEMIFDERALGIAPASATSSDSGEESASSVVTGTTDWRFVQDTVFTLYKRGVLGK